MVDCDEPTGVLDLAEWASVACLDAWPGVASCDELAEVLGWAAGVIV